VLKRVRRRRDGGLKLLSRFLEMPVIHMPLPQLIICFHGIGAPPAGIPEAERPYWIPEDEFNAFICAASRQAPALCVSLIASFDDGNRSDRDIAAPTLSRYGVPGLFFPLAGRFGLPGYLDFDDLRAMQDQGFQFGSHGVDHVPWTSLDAPVLRREISESTKVLEAALNRAVSIAALPFGAYNRRVLAALRDAGFSTVYSCDEGLTEAGRWLCRRWTYRVGMPLDIGRLVTTSRSPRHRLITASKEIIKSLR